MLGRTVRLQITAFIVIALLGISYLGIHYIGFGRLLGFSGYTVKLDLPSAGGIFSNAEVDYRGVPVGRVGAMRLTASGIQVDLEMDSGKHIPNDVEAVVTDRSAIGEQYVNLLPRRDNGPYLANGSVIAQKDGAIPQPISDLLLSTDQLFHSVPLGSLQTLVSEADLATKDTGQELQSLITNTKSFFAAAQDTLSQTNNLIANGDGVLATQQQEAQAITSFSKNLTLIAKSLKDSDGDLTKVIQQAAPAAQQFGTLISGVSKNVNLLLSNLLTTSVVFLGSKDGVRSLLANLPVAVTAGGDVVTPQGINVGAVPTFFDPLPCTQGYQGTHTRTGLDTSSSQANLSAGCTASASSGQDVRGSQNAPGG